MRHTHATRSPQGGTTIDIRDYTRKFFVAATLQVSLLISMGSAVHADDVITGCNQSCELDCVGNPNCRKAVSGKCRLDGNVSCIAGQGPISLTSGNDLDLAGYDITCTETGSNVCAYNAIVMAASGSKVTNSSTSDESVISGPFTIGVECGGYGSSIVEKLTVRGVIRGVNHCLTVRYNVIGPSAYVNFLGINFGISTGGVSNAESITDNYIDSLVFPIYSQSPYSTDIQRNVIRGTGEVGIQVGDGQSSSNGNIKFNVFFAPGGFYTSGSVIAAGGTDNVSYDGNFCDAGMSNCAACISAGRCEPYSSPFIGN